VPDATPAPLFTYSGDLRAFYFGRTNGNTCLTCKVKGAPDATAFNSGVLLHGELKVPRSAFSLGVTYFGAYPFGANPSGPLRNAGYNPELDNTLPGYSLSVLGEYYMQYRTAGTLFRTGRQIITTPWANAADSRVSPEAFQGTSISGNVTPDLNLGAMYIARFRSRVISAFNADTLLTSCNTASSTGKGPIAGVSGSFTVPGDPCNKQQTTSGFSEFSATYSLHHAVAAGINQYRINDIAEMTWVTAQYTLASSPLKPFLAGQFLAEANAGSSLVGTVDAHMAGVQFGTGLIEDLNLTVGYDGSPAVGSVVPVKKCKGTAPSPTAALPGVIFGGVADTTNKSVPPGDVMCYAGGIASPYSDNQATDPLYTTSLTQGLADVHKPGSGLKAALAWQAPDARLRLTVSQAWYDYSLPGADAGISNADNRTEFDADVQYFFGSVSREHPFKGLSIRQRYGDRAQTFSPYDFKYSRTQLEYTF
jgi:hypothetical protein